MKLNYSLLFATAALCNAATLKAPIMGRGVFVPEWEVEVTPGGPKTILHGTVEEVHKKLVKLNPNWDEEFFNTTASELSELGSGFELFTRDFQDIPDFAKDWDAPRSYCGGPWGEASVERILDGIGYLERWPGKPKNGPGPGNCGRVSCSWNSAIWWCNDTDKEKESSGFRSIIDGVRFIIKNCAPAAAQKVVGQAFHNTNWNVIVRKDKC